MTILEQLRQQRDELVAEARGLTNDGDLTGDVLVRFNAITDEGGELDQLEQRIERAERLDNVSGTPLAHRENGDGSNPEVRPGRRVEVSRTGAPGWQAMTHGRAVENPWDERSGAPILDRARSAVEHLRFGDHVDVDGTREKMITLLEVEDQDPRIAAWLTLTSDPAYARACAKKFRDPEHGADDWDADERGAFRRAQQFHRTYLNEGTTTQGGFLVPTHLDPSVILTNAGVTNPVRQLARVETIATNVWHGISSAGVTAGWRATEGEESTDDSPTIAGPSVTVNAYDAFVAASFEMIQDTAISTEVGRLLADAVDRLHGTAFTIGSGTNEPTGVVTAIGAITASRVAGSSGAAGAADYALADVYALDNALPARARPNAAWMAQISYINKTRRFGEGTTGSNSAFWADLGANAPPLLLGHPIHENSEMESTATTVSGSNDDVLMLADFRQTYVIVDRIGTSVQFVPILLGSNRRPTAQAGWFMFGRVGGNVVDGGANARLLRL